MLMLTCLSLSVELECSLPVSGPGPGSSSGSGCYGNVLPHRSHHPLEKSINATLVSRCPAVGTLSKRFVIFSAPLSFTETSL